MNLLATPVLEATWQVRPHERVSQEPAKRAELLAHVRGALTFQLKLNPALDQTTLYTPLGIVDLERQGPSCKPGGKLRLVFAPDCALLPRATDVPGSLYQTVGLPDPQLKNLAEHLVGLDAQREDMVLRICCRQPRGPLEVWAARTACGCSALLRRHLDQQAAV